MNGLVNATIGILALAWPISQAQTVGGFPTCAVSLSRISVQVGQSLIAVDVYTPTDRNQHPLIVMIHGSAGLFTGVGNRGEVRDNFGEGYLSSRCFVVALPHYFEMLGVQSLTSTAELRSKFPVLLAGLQKVLDRLEVLPEVGRSGVGLYGESYGGFLAVGLAGSRSEISAVSEFGGGLPPGSNLTLKSTRFLIQHGKIDELVSIREAFTLERAVDRSGGVATVVLYPEDGHYFSAASREKLLLETTEFFQRTLCLRP
jgi:dienelactone hydrolase